MLVPPDIIAGVMFVLLTGLVFAGYVLIARLQQNPIRDRLAALAGQSSAEFAESQRARPSLIDGLAEQLPQMNLDNGELDRDLRKAGVYRPNARVEYLALRNAMIILTVIITGIVAVAVGPENELVVLQILAVGLLVAIGCWAAPRIYISLRARARVRRITNALPDALEMIRMCLTGGLPLNTALGHVSREMYFAHPDLSVELSILGEQARIGTLSDAFRQFANRIDTLEVITLSTLVQQNQRLGSNVAESIEEYVDSMHETRRQIADERAGKVTVQLLFPVVLCLVPSVMIFLWGPAILELMDFIRSFEGPPASLG